MKNFYNWYKIYFPVIAFFIFLISCQKEIFVEPNSNELTIPNTRFIIESNPQGASIYLNNRNTGYVTPDTINWMPDGQSLVTLKMENYLDSSFSMNFQSGEVSSASINYYLNPRMLGNILCTTSPAGAKIYLDDNFTGRVTPAMFSGLIPKKYKVKYELAEHRLDSSNVIVVSSQTKTLNIAMEDTLDIIRYRFGIEIPSYFVNSIEEDKDGNIWFGSMEGLTKYDGKNFITYNMSTSTFMTSNMVFSIKNDNDGNIWVGTSNSLLKYNGTVWTIYNSKMVNDLYVGFDNTILAATEGGGIKKIVNGVVENITMSSNGLQNNGIQAVCYDLNMNIWAGPYYNGVNIFNNQNWTYLNVSNNGAPYDNNCELFMNKNGIMYGVFFKNYPPADAPVPTDIVKYENMKWTKVYSTLDKIYDREPFFDSKNRLWIGLEGIMRITPENKVENIYSIVNQNLRLFKYYGNKWNYLYAKKALIDSKGNLWMIGGYYGVLKVKPGRWYN